MAVSAVLITNSHATNFDMSIDCKSPQNNYEVGQCIGREFEEADARMSKTYFQLFGKLTSDAQTKLKNAQRAWLKFRDGNCEFVGSGTVGGSANGSVIGTCRTTVTNKRMEELRDWLQCQSQEGNLSCPAFK